MDIAIPDKNFFFKLVYTKWFSSIITHHFISLFYVLFLSQDNVYKFLYIISILLP